MKILVHSLKIGFKLTLGAHAMIGHNLFHHNTWYCMVSQGQAGPQMPTMKNIEGQMVL